MNIQRAMNLIGLLVLALMVPVLACARQSNPDEAPLLPVGETPAQELSAVDQDGTSHRLGDYRGRVTVVFFYPKDGTPGCTREACAFRDVWNKYKAARVQVLGVSADDQASKAKFAAEHRLTFPLLADPQRQWIKAFRVPTRLGMANRVSFLLDKQGRVARVYPNVDPGVHAAQVLEDAQGLL